MASNANSKLGKKMQLKGAEVLKEIQQRLLSSGIKNYPNYLKDRFVELKGSSPFYLAIDDITCILEEVNEQYKSDQIFAKKIDTAVEVGSRYDSMFPAGERLETLLNFFESLNHSDFIDFISIHILEHYAESIEPYELQLL